MIRFATLKDLPELVELGRLFLESTILAEIAPYDPGSAWETARNLIENDDAAIFVFEKNGKVVGFISGFLSPVYWNFSLLSAQQMAYYVLPEHRGFSSLKLKAEWQKWADSKQTSVYFSGAKKDDRFKGMNDMLERDGYVELETVHVKGVKICQQRD